MAETLVIDPLGDNIIVSVQRAGLQPDRRVGDIDAASAGNRRSFIVAEYRVAALVFVNASPAVCRQIKRKFALGAQVPCAGSVWLNDDDSEIVVCDGVYSDDMEQGGPWRVPGITLNEVGSAVNSTPVGAGIFLANVVSPADGTKSLATAVESEDPFYAGLGSRRILDEANPSPCAGPDPCTVTYTDPEAPEHVWRSAPFIAAGPITGPVLVQLLSKGATGAYPWATQSARFRVAIVRGGTEVLETWTGWGLNGGFSGGWCTMNGLDSVIFDAEIGDFALFELHGRIALQPGQSDNNPYLYARQTVYWGNGGAAAHYGFVSWAGLAACLNP